jgi:hypothetical protein
LARVYPEKDLSSLSQHYILMGMPTMKKVSVFVFISFILFVIICDGSFFIYEYNPLRILVEPVLEPDRYAEDMQGNKAYSPYINVIITNEGRGAANISQIIFNITSAYLNTTPVLNTDLGCGDEDIFVAEIENSGWGIAREIQWDSTINLGKYTNYLKIDNNKLNWTGDLDPGKRLNLNFKFRPKAGYRVSFLGDRCFDTLVYTGKIKTIINYKNINNIQKPTIFFNNTLYLFKINPLRICDYSLAQSLVRMGDLKAEKIFYIDSLDPERNYSIDPGYFNFSYNDNLRKDDISKIIIKINSTKKSGKFISKLSIIWNKESSITSGDIILNLIKDNSCDNESCERTEIVDLRPKK